MLQNFSKFIESIDEQSECQQQYLKLLFVRKKSENQINITKVKKKEAKVSSIAEKRQFQEEEDFQSFPQEVLLQHQYHNQGINEANQPIKNKIHFYSLHEKKPEVHKSLLKSRIFYVSIHILTFALIIFYDNEIKDQFIEGESLFPYIYVILALLSSYFFWICGNNPGYAPFETDVEMQNPLNREISSTAIQNNDELEGKNNQGDDIQDNDSNTSQRSASKYKIPIPQNSLAFGNNLEQGIIYDDGRKQNSNNLCQDVQNQSTNFNYITSPKVEKRQILGSNESSQSELLPYPIEETMQNNIDPQISNQDEERYLANQKYSGSGSVNSDSSEDFNDDFLPEDQRSSSNTNEDSEQLDAPPPLFNCNICKRFQPYRSKHCYDCGRCINKFDHHWYNILKIQILQQFKVLLSTIISFNI